MKVQSKELLKAIFCGQKVNEKADKLYMKFLQPPIPVCRGAYTPYFKINTPVFCFALASEN